MKEKKNEVKKGKKKADEEVEVAEVDRSNVYRSFFHLVVLFLLASHFF